MRPWQPWPPRLAQSRFLTKLEALLAATQAERGSRERTQAEDAANQAIQAGAP